MQVDPGYRSKHPPVDICNQALTATELLAIKTLLLLPGLAGTEMISEEAMACAKARKVDLNAPVGSSQLPYVPIEARNPSYQPLWRIRTLVGQVRERLNPSFFRLYAPRGTPISVAGAAWAGFSAVARS